VGFILILWVASNVENNEEILCKLECLFLAGLI
jgi:hypothetical protein